MHLVDRIPQMQPEELLTGLVPPPHFANVSFDSYRPDPAQPSQAQARDQLQAFVDRKGGESGGFLAKLFGSGRSPSGGGIYLDGGYGVGKTHLLASSWHAHAKPAAFGTFVEYTNLVGALGFAQARERLSEMKLVCIDEFELDDPGDTVLMSRLMRELTDAGVKIIATSNTLPGALGEGRFAAQDFLREIQALAAQFTVYRIDGEDYRHRGLPTPPEPLSDDEVAARAHRRAAQHQVALDSFEGITTHLEKVHPSRYGKLLDGVAEVYWTGVAPVSNQSVALRLVALVDRMYDRNLPLVTSGVPLDDLFTEEMVTGGYRKKYLRCLSRLTALAREGGERG
ncbi:cell division protein ZapE [Sediminivirga luteola]|nr:cell division protein ZapE [Sediminivirga luteola]MCI2264192.1 cell division protein ZapE [Sediminivirga luteola]